MASLPGDRAIKMAKYADRVAEHGDRIRAGQEIGVSKSYARVLWQHILRGLGPQAQ